MHENDLYNEYELKLTVAGTANTEEGGDVFRLSRILGLIAGAVEGPGWGKDTRLGCAEPAFLAT